MFDLEVNCSVESCTKDVLPVKCEKCDSAYCKEHFKSDLTHNCMMTDAKCLNCGVRIDRVTESSVARISQEKAIFKQQKLVDDAKIRALEKKLFDLSHDLEKARTDSIKFQEMKDENIRLSKDILVLGEMYNKMKEKVEAMNSNHFLRASQISDRTKLKTMERELDRERLAADNRTRERDWFRGRCGELEDLLQKKELALNEGRKLNETNQSESKAKLDAQSQRINALMSIKKQLSDHILELNRKLGSGPQEQRQTRDPDRDNENGCDTENDAYVELS